MTKITIFQVNLTHCPTLETAPPERYSTKIRNNNFVGLFHASFSNRKLEWKGADEPERGAAGPWDASLYLAYLTPGRWSPGSPSSQRTAWEMPHCSEGAWAFRMNSKYREHLPCWIKMSPRGKTSTAEHDRLFGIALMLLVISNPGLGTF